MKSAKGAHQQQPQQQDTTTKTLTGTTTSLRNLDSGSQITGRPTQDHSIIEFGPQDCSSEDTIDKQTKDQVGAKNKLAADNRQFSHHQSRGHSQQPAVEFPDLKLSQKAPAIDQRIKVTLSAPRNSTDFQASAEPILIADPEVNSSAPQIEIELEKDTRIRRRQSTATLISAEVATGNGSSQQSAAAEKTAKGGETGTGSGGQRQPLSRSEQESELRRIASQRRKVQGAEEPTSGQRRVPQPEATAIATKPAAGQNLVNRQKSLVARQTTDQHQSRQNQTQQPPASELQPNPKQLAIYINGKIRSNSIFCRSNSSNSFNGLLNRFSPTSSQNQNQDSRAGDQENSNCDNRSLLRGNSKTKSDCDKSQQKKRKRKSAKKKTKFEGEKNWTRKRESSEGASFTNLGYSLRKFLTNYLLPANSNKKQASNCRLPNADPEQSSDKLSLGSRQSAASCSVDSDSTSSRDRSGSSDQDRESGEGYCNNNNKKLELEKEQEQKPATSYKLNPSSMFLRKAMRYYRLWIYCTNITILLGTLIFILSAIYVTSDYRIKLLVSSSSNSNSISSSRSANNKQADASFLGGRISGQQREAGSEAANNNNSGQRHDDSPSGQSNSNNREDDSDYEQQQYSIPISYSEPCVILAYVAIAIQAGLLQAIGCFGAVRMKEKWIQTFWYLILALTVFDVVFLVYWLNRYDFVVKSLRNHMSLRLEQQYGFHMHHSNSTSNLMSSSPASRGDSSGPELGPFRQEIDLKLDKILTEIIDKIQTESQCCGITSSLDYRASRWRQRKVAELTRRLQAEGGGGSREQEKDPAISGNLMSRVPLVPASCCRRPKQKPAASRADLPVILDDSQVKRPNRVPAWQPSMVVEDLQLGNGAASRARLMAGGGGSSLYTTPALDYGDDSRQVERRAGEELAELLDARWTATDPQDERRLERRLLAKQEAYATAATASSEEDDNNRPDYELRPRRWVVESRVDEQQRVSSRLIRLDDLELAPDDWPLDSSGNSSEPEAVDSDEQTEGSQVNEGTAIGVSSSSKEQNRIRLAKLRRLLFGLKCCELRDFRRPNKLQLDYEQYKLIETYLLQLSAQGSSAAGGSRSGSGEGGRRPKRTTLGQGQQLDAGEGQISGNNNNSGLFARIQEVVRLDPELKCAPRSYYDRAAINTRGCYPEIRSWLDSSAHILFVTGFCVLTVLKFCSVVLLRLEIREMIHKIKVLKGMATEYNALHDLEAYLPRPSVCAQAAELTPSGVALTSPAGGATSASATAASLAIGQSAAATLAAGQLQATGSSGNQLSSGAKQSAAPTHRLGGSFSEAVAAATAAAAAANQQRNYLNYQALGLGGLASSGRAASMKAVTAMSNMLAPTLCPRSSSTTSGHLQTAFLAGGSQHAKHQHLRSGSACLDPFLMQVQAGSGMMSRRHTAISVCPAAAAAAAAAAAQHLMSRRGTYVANPLFGGQAPGVPQPPTSGHQPHAPMSSGQQQQASYLHHRHSAHTVHSLLQTGSGANSSCQSVVAPSSKRQQHQKQQSIQSGNTSASGKSAASQYLSDGRQSTIEHQSSGDSGGGGGSHSNNKGSQCQMEAAEARSESQQQLSVSLVYPFKRQSSGGAKSAGDFSLDLEPALLTESRRSIH